MLISSLLALSFATAAAAAAPCSRPVLEEATTRYVAAQSQGQKEWLRALLSENLIYVENNNETSIDDGSLRRPLKIERARHIYDTTQCATYSELIALDPSPGVVIGTQMRFATDSGSDGNGTGAAGSSSSSITNKIEKIDSIVTTAGDLYFNASHTLHYVLLEDWSRIALADRDARQTLTDAADAYYALFSDNTTTVPWGTPCRRLEGGAYMAAGLANDTCDAGLPPFAVQMTGRRYVVDEEVGSVNILSHFGILGPDSHEIRVEGGRIRYIHAITACDVKPGCDAPEFPGLTDDVGY
ncbi:hypothetical protein AAE478_000382 [Parahypoxylon ruwenzoriense]